jgi:hypothetical protein
VTDTMASDRTVWTSPRRFWFVLGIVIASFILGVSTGNREVAGSKDTIKKLQRDKIGLTDDKGRLQKELSELQDKLTSAQAKLAAIMPSSNVYEISANQSQIVPYGHLTIGLVNTPGNESVDLNINDKRHSAAAGEVINIAIEQSLTCRVEVMSFDVVKSRVVVNATCAEAKH